MNFRNSGKSDWSDSSEVSDQSKCKLIPKHGGYRKLRSFQAAQLVYDGTAIFCERFVDKRSRTHDQMVQAARSGVQNIAEGSMASATSKKTELKLTGVARASLEELLLDYQDFLRQHGLRQWDKNSPQALAVRRKYMSDESNRSDLSDLYSFRSASPEITANTLICLINQASFLLAGNWKLWRRTSLSMAGSLSGSTGREAGQGCPTVRTTPTGLTAQTRIAVKA